ncbi:MAG: TIGR00730 family Rossman fold protein [Cytophagaceae bacterium]|nr:TIGR00730 family Rossman fold protein [Cytophagaceae bacterium]
MKKLCVFCGSSVGYREIFRETATELGRAMVSRGIDLVYGGGHVGLMGVLADAVLAQGGQVVGVIPQFLKDWEVAHSGVTELIVSQTMHERKARMAGLADGFIALPGGYGTLDELFEILTWKQLRLHAKPVGILNADGFFSPLLQMLDSMVAEGFVNATNRQLILVADGVDELLEKMTLHTPKPGEQWVNSEKL